jgi:hypothetical protein
MVQRLESEWSGRVGDILAVLVPNGTILATVNLIPVNHAIQMLAGIVTIGYAIWRWRRDSFVMCQACRDGRPPENCPLAPRKRPTWCPRNL